MTYPIKAAITVGEANWTPLKRALPMCELENFMYMGRVEEIELYKHRFTRRYLNIGRNSHKFYRYLEGKYIETTRAAALEHVRG